MRTNSNLSRGFTLVELLVTMGVVLIVLTAAYQSYIHLLRGFVTESASTESQIAAVVNTNILRLDIVHAGFGIAEGEGNMPIQWNNSTQSLTIRSMINNMQEESLGWIMCSNGTVVQDNNESSWDGYVFTTKENTLESVDTASGTTNCPSTGIHLGYPFDTDDIPAGCTSQPCFNVTYEMSSTQDLDSCADGTRNLLRRVSGNYKPILNCVADWQVAIEHDMNDDGVLESTTGDLGPTATNADRIKQIHVYALVQEGAYEQDHTFSGSTSIDSVMLSLPGTGEADHYRWKTMKLSVNPQDL